MARRSVGGVIVMGYEIDKTDQLGFGGFGKVFVARDANNETFAAKRCEEPENAAHEAAVLRAVGDHPSIAGLKDHFEVGGRGWLFVELATGGELTDRLVDSGRLEAREARELFAPLVAALCHCHGRGVVHRDVKMDNVMLCAADASAVKLIDFGLGVVMPLEEMDTRLFTDSPGSRHYRAPEMLDWQKRIERGGFLAPPTDVWAAGVLLYTLVVGGFPWEVAHAQDTHYAAAAADAERGPCRAALGASGHRCALSEPLVALLDAMLCADPAARISIDEVRRHGWLTAPPALGEVSVVSEPSGEERPADLDRADSSVVFRGAPDLERPPSARPDAFPPGLRVTREPAAVAWDLAAAWVPPEDRAQTTASTPPRNPQSALRKKLDTLAQEEADAIAKLAVEFELKKQASIALVRPRSCIISCCPRLDSPPPPPPPPPPVPEDTRSSRPASVLRSCSSSRSRS
jgi:serine/threonine protein kinase